MTDEEPLASRVDELAAKLESLEQRLASVQEGGEALPEPESSLDREYCSVPGVPGRQFEANVTTDRASLIRVISTKWVNGTVLHYYFYDQESDGQHIFFNNGTHEWRSWTADDVQKNVVRQGLGIWEDVDIGIRFEEVTSREDAEIRIGFMRGDGAWSYVGRQVLDLGANERTMNFGWDLARPNDTDTPVHESGHTLGFPHEHQNPNSGIVWDEDAVYRRFAGSPNYWPRDKTYYNIIRKIEPDSVQGSNWDKDSIMHYSFQPRLIKEPRQYYSTGLQPDPGLSDRDRAQVRFFYPHIPPEPQYPELEVFGPQVFSIQPGEQVDFSIESDATQYYEIQTFGRSDTVMVLFEDQDGDPRYLTADDDSGTRRNARLHVKLYRGTKYLLRIRLYYGETSGRTAVMMW